MVDTDTSCFWNRISLIRYFFLATDKLRWKIKEGYIVRLLLGDTCNWASKVIWPLLLWMLGVLYHFLNISTNFAVTCTDASTAGASWHCSLDHFFVL